MNTSRTVDTDDLEFLLGMDKRLHKVIEGRFTPNISGETYVGSVDAYTDSSLTSDEIQRVLEAVESSGLVFYPINTAQGLSVGFQVADPETGRALLKFREAQLPEGYDFNTLSEYFMRPENVERARLLGVSIVDDRGHYNY